MKRIKQQQPGSPEDLRLIYEANTVNAKILESTTHSVLTQLNCHSNGEWYQCPIGKIRGIIRGLNNALNIALTVENATEEEIVEKMMNYRHEPTVANQVNEMNVQITQNDEPIQTNNDEISLHDRKKQRQKESETLALRFLKERCEFKPGERTKSGDVIRAFLEWLDENDEQLDCVATNKVSPLLQKMLPSFGKSTFSNICSFGSGKLRTQSPGFQNFRIK
jgi:hypothetical protein